MHFPFKIRRRFSNGRLKYFVVALTLATLTYYYLFRSLNLRGRLLNPKEVAANATLGVSNKLPRLVLLFDKEFIETSWITHSY
jgi:hypothetical protein